MLRKVAAVGFAGLVLGVSPARADSISNGEMVALTMLTGGGLMSIGCMAIALLTQDDEDEQEGYDRRGIYLALSGSYARENFGSSGVAKLVTGDLLDGLRVLRETPELDDDGLPLPGGDPGLYSIGFGDVEDGDAFGATGRGGYRCHPRVSAELQFERLENFGVSILETGMQPGNDTLRKFDLELESLVLTSNAKGHLLTGRYQPFVLAGVGFMRMESKTYDVSPAALPRPDSCDPDLAVRCSASNQSKKTVRLAFRFGGGLDFYLTKQVVISAEGSYLLPTGKLDDLAYYTFSLGLQYRF